MCIMDKCPLKSVHPVCGKMLDTLLLLWIFCPKPLGTNSVYIDKTEQYKTNKY